MSKKKSSLLWRLEGSQWSAPSYLFGTMHVKDQRAFGFIEEVFKRIDACQTFATEFNLEEAAHQTQSDAMDLPEGYTLEELLGAKKFKKVGKVFQKATGLDINHFNNCQPILISNLMSESILSADMPLSLDETLWKYARSNDRVVLGIETFQEQLEILKKIPLEYQVKSLLDIARNFKSYRKQLLKMTGMYESADLHQLHQSARKSVKGMRKLMLYNRNVIMADRIAKMAAEQSLFAAVGAGHLGGKKGVLSLLKKKGIKVSPVRMDKTA